MGNPINPNFNKLSNFGRPYSSSGVEAAVPGTNAGTNMPSAGGWIGLGSSLMTGMGQMIPTPYNQQIGAERPNFFKSMSDMTFTGMGATIGGPWGALVGGIIDTGKNIGNYLDSKGKWNTAVTKFENREAMNQRLDSMGADYTGAARYGAKIPMYRGGGCTPKMEMGGQSMGVPVELEMNEVVLMPQQDGSYQMIGETGPNAPAHEQGGLKTNLPQGALVFPGKYVGSIKQAMQQGDYRSIDQMAQQMMAESQQAAQQGKPFSNGAMFGNGGQVLAEKVRSYNPLEDKERAGAQSILSDIETRMNFGQDTDGYLDQDQADILTMGLIARTNPNHPAALELKEKYPDQYSYFIGEEQGTKPVELFPKGVPDQLQGREVSAFGNMHNREKTGKDELSKAINYGAYSQSDKKYLAGAYDKGEEIKGFNPQQFYGYLQNTGKMGNQQVADTNPMNQQANTQQQNTTPVVQPTIDNSVLGKDRTASRHAAMNSGVYYGKNGEALTYWDDKAGKRMFNSAAKQYGLSGEFKTDMKYSPTGGSSSGKSTGGSGTPSGSNNSKPTSGTGGSDGDFPTIFLTDEEVEAGRQGKNQTTPTNSVKGWPRNPNSTKFRDDEYEMSGDFVVKQNFTDENMQDYSDKTFKSPPGYYQAAEERHSKKMMEQAKNKPAIDASNNSSSSIPKQDYRSSLAVYSGDVDREKYPNFANYDNMLDMMRSWEKIYKRFEPPTIETLSGQTTSDLSNFEKSMFDDFAISKEKDKLYRQQQIQQQVSQYQKDKSSELMQYHLQKGTMLNEFRNLIGDETLANEYAQMFHQKRGTMRYGSYIPKMK